MKFLMLLAALASLTTRAWADITLIQNVKSDDTAQAGTVVTLRSKDAKTRIDMGAEMSTISDVADGKITTLMHPTKMAMEMPASIVKEMSATMKDAAAKSATTPPEYKPTGRTETISGFACAEYSITSDGKSVNAWFTKEIPDFDRIVAAVEKIQASMGTFPSGGDDFKSMPGFPVRTVIEMPGGGKTTITLVSVSTDSIDDATFEIPSDYQSVQVPNPTQSQP